MYVYPPLLYLLHLYTILNYKYLICFANRQIPIYNGQFNQKAPQKSVALQKLQTHTKCLHFQKTVL